MRAIRNYFILIPADTPDGPIKGAYALANSLSQHRNVTLVSIKKGPGANAALSDSVRKICLADHKDSYIERLSYFQKLLKSAGRRDEVLLSPCVCRLMLST